jgi:hypothetical protein
MLEQLIATAGIWFLAACALEALATFVEVAGAARSPEEEAPRRGVAALAVLAVTMLTPGLLLAHGFLSTHGAEPMLRVWALGAPAAALVGGAILGGVFGAVARPAAALMRKLALPFGVAALAVTIYATLPSIVLLTEAARSGGIIELAPE